jgi:hypothetical protein
MSARSLERPPSLFGNLAAWYSFRRFSILLWNFELCKCMNGGGVS